MLEGDNYRMQVLEEREGDNYFMQVLEEREGDKLKLILYSVREDLILRRLSISLLFFVD